MQTLLASLNPKQLEAVQIPSGSALILAGAGSGKTKVLTTRIAWLIKERQVKPLQIMAVTFTNKAAKEMKERLLKLVDNVGGLFIGTFHGLCHQMLRENYVAANLPKGFQIIDQDEQLTLVKKMLKELGWNEEEFLPKDVAAFIGRNKEQGIRPRDIDLTRAFQRVKDMTYLYDEYQQRCDRYGFVDFGELMLRTLEMFTAHPAVLDRYRLRFTHILVDEFQDTNKLQYQWLGMLKNPSAAIFAVGDDDQSIYGFRLAEPENINRFLRDHAKGQLVKLEQNYRSTGNILAAANSVIANNKDRLGKSLWTEQADGNPILLRSFDTPIEEAEFVADEIGALYADGTPYEDIAVLYRVNAFSRLLEQSLMRRGIPAMIVGGVRFYSRLEIKNLVAYLRLAQNRHDDQAFLRVCNYPPRGIGTKSIGNLEAAAKEQGVSLWTAAANEMAAGGKSKFGAFISLADNVFNLLDSVTLPEFIQEVIDLFGLAAHHEKIREAERNENMDELVNAAAQFIYTYDSSGEGSPLDNFLADIVLAGAVDAPEGDKSGKAVTLMTTHGSKGLEFPYVFIIGLEDGSFPHALALQEGGLEEERRLMYVAITRAKHQLYMSHANSRMVSGNYNYFMASRFLREVPRALIDAPDGFPFPEEEELLQ